jgi:hypothetical protein
MKRTTRFVTLGFLAFLSTTAFAKTLSFTGKTSKRDAAQSSLRLLPNENVEAVVKVIDRTALIQCAFRNANNTREIARSQGDPGESCVVGVSNNGDHATDVLFVVMTNEYTPVSIKVKFYITNNE